MITIYTDGSCRQNGAAGGYGVVVMENDQVVETKSYQTTNTTNNRMELSAILYVMETFGTKDLDNIPLVYTDSEYCYNSLTKWMFGWASNNWMKSDNKEVLNTDIIQRYYDLWIDGYRINLQWVRGHNGCYGNELADKLATGKMD